MQKNTFTVEFREGRTQEIEAEYLEAGDHVITLMVMEDINGSLFPAAVAAFPRESVRGIYPKGPARVSTVSGTSLWLESTRQ